MTTATQTKSNRKATHSGECQCCGRKQKLPGERLSLHGYTTRWGFFSGVCPGANHLPYEQSCEMVQRAADDTQRRLAKLEDVIAELRKNNRTDDVIHDVRLPVGRGRFEYVDKHGRVEVTPETTTYASGNTVTTHTHEFIYRDGQEEKRVHIEGYQVRYTHDASEAALILNTGHAAKLDRQAKQMQQYIAWALKRVADWQPRELTPVK